VSDLAGIHAVAAERKGRMAAWRAEVAPPFFVGDQPARPAQPGLPGAPGQGQGPVQVVPSVPPNQAPITVGCAVAGIQPDSGWAVFLPAAVGLLAAQGSLLDPAVAAARALGIPAVVELGGAVAELEIGRRVTVDGERGCVG
jgi:phosphohistidine swiveling domain-containing protein